MHITASERKAWNGKVDASTLNSHTGNTEIHTTSAEKASWNNKAEKASLNAHISDTVVHIQEGEREAWNAKYSKPSTGIPKTDLAEDVQTEINKVNTAITTAGEAKQAVTTHTKDSVIHITADERTAWNGKADESSLTAHTGDTTIHITASERSSWNSKYSKPATGIPVDDMEAGVAESLANADLALADVGALSQNFINHEGDTTVHITANERKAWNAKANASTLNSHTGNTTIHTTAEEKASWNGKYTKPTTGIPAEDLSDDVNASINSGSMSYELASEANGKVSLLLESYGAEIPDLKNELAKKQDKLVSGTSIKTVNGTSLLGSGNITTPKTTVVDNLTSTSGTDALSANQGKVLSDRLNNGDFSAKEAKMQWGGKNNNEGNLSPIESLLTDSANRLTFGNAGGVTVEYSTDGGSTWNAYTERTDYEKLLYPIADAVFCLGGSNSTDRATTLNDMLRITINAKGVGRYLGGIRKMLIYGGTRNARSLNVVLEARRATGGVEGGGNNAFEQVGTLTYDGWPAWGAISLNDSFFGTWSTATTYNNRSVIEYRLTFSVNSVSNTTYGAPYIQLIKLHSLTVYEANEFIAKYGNPLLLMNDGYIHADRELYLTKRVQAQNMQVSNLNVLSSLNITPSTTIQGVLTVGSKISAGGNIEGSAKLTVEGDATLKSNATVSGDLSVGGTLNYTRTRLETSEASVMLDASKYTVINCGGELTINLPNGYATDGKEYLCEMRTGSIGPTVSFPADIKFAFGENFVLGFQPNSVYQISIQNSLAVVIPFV